MTTSANHFAVNQAWIQQAQAFCISGVESLLVEQSVQNIRNFAKQKGFTDIHRFFSNEPASINAKEILLLSQSKGLFAQGSLLELHLHNANPSAEVKKVIEQFSQPLTSHCLFVVIANGVSLRHPAWLKKFAQQHQHVDYPRLNNRAQAKWLQQQSLEFGIDIDDDAKNLLLSATEGNLNALFHELNQLHLMGIKTLKFAELRKRIADEGKFGAFQVASYALTRRANRALRVCRGLRRDGESAILINWHIFRDSQIALAMAEARRLNQSIQRISEGQRLWPARIAQLQQIAALGEAKLNDIVQQCLCIDRQCKGQLKGDEWISLETLITTI